MENGKIISLANLFQHLLSAEIYLNEKLKLYLIYLVRNFQIYARNKQESAFEHSSIIQDLILNMVAKSM